MTKQMKTYLSIGVVLATGICLYLGWRLLKAPAASVAASSLSAGKSAGASGTGATAPPMSDVDLVRNGALPEYKDRTVSKAFEATFQDPEWKSAVNLQGQKVVIFHGTVKYAPLKEAGFYVGTWNGVPQGIEAERQISELRHRCLADAGQPDTPVPDDTLIGPCMAKAYESIVIPVSFELVLSPDGKGVEMTMPDPVFQRFGPDHRLRKERDATLAFIYR
jgi:hypothetical protein